MLSGIGSHDEGSVSELYSSKLSGGSPGKAQPDDTDQQRLWSYRQLVELCAIAHGSLARKPSLQDDPVLSQLLPVESNVVVPHQGIESRPTKFRVPHFVARNVATRLMMEFASTVAHRTSCDIVTNRIFDGYSTELWKLIGNNFHSSKRA